MLKPRFASSSAIRGLCGVQLDASDVHLIQTKSRSQSEAIEQIVAFVPFVQIAKEIPVTRINSSDLSAETACPKVSVSAPLFGEAIGRFHRRRKHKCPFLEMRRLACSNRLERISRVP
jgi:hypothetical protein